MVTHPFEHHGYHIDYWVNSKYVGSIKTDTPDRSDMGYTGRKTFTLANQITVNKNGGKDITLPAGVQVTTELIPICGKIIGNTLDERLNVLKQHYLNSPYKKHRG